MSFFSALKNIVQTTPGLSSCPSPFLSVAMFDAQRELRRIKLLARRGESAETKDINDRTTLIIEIAYGGLGDTLFHSHLPRLAKESGKYSAVLLSNMTPFRDPVHRRVVWQLNPYVDGFVDKPGVLFQHLLRRKGISPVRFRMRDGMNLLDEIMLAYGFDDGLRFHEPELYYKPNNVIELSDKVIFDPNWVSPVNDETTISRIERYFAENGIKSDMQFAPRKNSRPLAACSTYIRDRSFEHFCDIVYSCKDIYCFATGTAVLAAALGKKANVFYHKGINRDFLFSKLHNYIDLDSR